MTEQEARKLKGRLEVIGVLAGVGLGVAASIGADRVTRVGLRMIPLAGTSKLTRVLAPIGILGMGAAAGTLAGQGMEKRIENITKAGCTVTDWLTKKDKKESEDVEEELDNEAIERMEEQLKENIAELANQLTKLKNKKKGAEEVTAEEAPKEKFKVVKEEKEEKKDE